ncbi:MAG: type I-C CRISPR-associated protein Cas5 [Elusimicrobia bacterium]|nr:type I-C CRISPR-associated protein Cas5 [Elusimicrobiota bacterium]
MSDGPLCSVKVWGDFACFTRPELKVERVSYPVPTPSAARGVFEAILFKPEFRWRVREIKVLRPIRYLALRRNEVQGVASTKNVAAAMRGKPFEPLYADDMDDAGSGRTQRQTLALRDVAYVFIAEPGLFPGTGEDVRKYAEQFKRRVERGQCFQQPYLGCREFAASFAPPDGDETPWEETRDLGWMLYDIFDLAAKSGRILDEKALANVRRLSLFEAKLDGGLLRIPAWDSPAVRRASL